MFLEHTRLNAFYCTLYLVYFPQTFSYGIEDSIAKMLEVVIGINIKNIFENKWLFKEELDVSYSNEYIKSKNITKQQLSG